MLYKRLLAAATAVLLAVGLAGCSGDSGRPSKDDVKAGLSTAMADALGGGDQEEASALYDQLLSCMIDEVYDDLSDDALKILASGNVEKIAKISGKDEELLDQAFDKCEDLDVNGDGDTDGTSDPPNDPANATGSIAIDGVELAKAGANKDVVVVTFTWTNATTETQEFSVYTEIEVSQNGEELERCYSYADGPDGPDLSAKEAEPAETIEVRRAWYIKDHSDVSIRVTASDADPVVVLTGGTFPLE